MLKFGQISASEKLAYVIVFTFFKGRIFIKVRIKLENSDNYSMF